MTAEIMSEEKPYRPNVGIALFNAAGQVLIGRRFRDDGPEIILPGFEWQMPQGGIDAAEDPRVAMMRELWEETGVVSAVYLGETDWLSYEFPPYAGPPSHRRTVPDPDPASRWRHRPAPSGLYRTFRQGRPAR